MTTELLRQGHNDFRFIQLSATTKGAFKRAGLEDVVLECRRVGWRTYGRKRFPEYRYFYFAGSFPANTDCADKHAAALRETYRDTELTVSIKYHCAD